MSCFLPLRQQEGLSGPVLAGEEGKETRGTATFSHCFPPKLCSGQAFFLKVFSQRSRKRCCGNFMAQKQSVFCLLSSEVRNVLPNGRTILFCEKFVPSGVTNLMALIKLSRNETVIK